MSNISTSSRRDKIFLDTAFLAAFSIPNHGDSKKARKLLTELVLKYDLCTSPLCFYELWQVVKKYKDFDQGNYRFIRRLNGVLKFIYLKIIFEEANLSYRKVVSDLKKFTNQITSFITIISLTNKSIDLALGAIDKFDTKPGDAFHFSVITNQKINFVATGNRKEFERMGLNVIWF